MWQSLQESARDQGFTVLAIALDEPEAARPWIEAASPSFPCLIDREHRVAELYNLVNVPQAVWIDEAGRMVRAPETAGSTDGFRQRDRATNALPAEVVARRERVKAAYFDAVRDWASNGVASRHVQTPDEVLKRLKVPDAGIAEAHARCRLGQALMRENRDAEARLEFDTASRLHPDSWAIWRQYAERDSRSLAAGPAFWARVDALGEKPYYPAADILPEADVSTGSDL